MKHREPQHGVDTMSTSTMTRHLTVDDLCKWNAAGLVAPADVNHARVYRVSYSVPNPDNASERIYEIDNTVADTPMNAAIAMFNRIGDDDAEILRVYLA
jgi:hypothetical protein